MQNKIYDLIKKTVTTLPPDVLTALKAAKQNETLKLILKNAELAKRSGKPLCQDTGMLTFYVSHPEKFDQESFMKKAKASVKKATKDGILRSNLIETLSGKPILNNCDDDHPIFYFTKRKNQQVEVSLLLKGGGCENVSAQYALSGERDLHGVRKVILETLFKAQGCGCAPGFLSVVIGGDRADGYIVSKKMFLEKVGKRSAIKELAELERSIIRDANVLGIGPLGLGGETTLIDCKIKSLSRLPASYFVTVSYMCHSYRKGRTLV